MTKAEKKFEKLPLATARADDDEAMDMAIITLLAQHEEVRRPDSRYQLKVSPEVSFYPRNGRIYIDGEAKAERRTGTDALIAILDERDELHPPR